MEQYLVIDLEMCKVPAKVRRKTDRNLFFEIIQIGAAVLDEQNQISDQFSTYVRPQYGEIEEEIENLTGITNEMVKEAPLLSAALARMSQWMAGREFHVLSWSETDYNQLQSEMHSKRVNNRMVEKLFHNWSDLQRAFSNMIDLEYILSLERVLEASGITLVGSLHNGLDDAVNTAQILQKIQKHKDYKLDLQNIEIKEKEVKHLNTTMSSFFSADILQQFSLTVETEEEEEISDYKKDPYRDYRRLLFGTERETGDCWPLYVYQQKINKTQQ